MRDWMIDIILTDSESKSFDEIPVGQKSPGSHTAESRRLNYDLRDAEGQRHYHLHEDDLERMYVLEYGNCIALLKPQELYKDS